MRKMKLSLKEGQDRDQCATAHARLSVLGRRETAKTTVPEAPLIES
jgi:hypothetical protein